MKVYLIRHGQTNGNAESFHQGWGNSHLTEKGVEQATHAREVITKKEFDRIICSDLLRTRQTCDIIFGENANVEYDARLREINNTVFIGQHRADLEAKYGEEYRENCRLMDYSPYGGESSTDFLARAADFMKCLEKDETSKRIAVITHGGTLRAILCYVLGMPLYTTTLKIDNCSISVVEYKNGHWTLIHFNNKSEI